nr:TPA_asm: ND5 [Gammarus fossarum]
MWIGPKVYSVFMISLFFSSAVMFFIGLIGLTMNYSLIIEWELWGLSSSLFSMSLVFDWMSMLFLGSVCLISSCIMKYSEYYMEGEINFLRFVYIMLMFVVSMWFLIISPNMVSLLLGWDGLGLTSYALVIFYQSEFSCNAGMLTVLSNRIGDVAILLSVALMFGSGGWDFYFADLDYNNMLIFFVVVAGATKSAQMPFSAWLPAAMAAPTPVSALVHSSTLVTAGVYLLIRFSSPIYDSGLGVVVLSASVLTMVVAGFSAMLESDMKKLVALSTLSQLGIMMMILSTGMKELAFFHLVTHAMFKSALFMCTGFMIHNVGGTQDSRVVSGFGVSSPILGILLSSTNLALCGFPFLAGFYSKDMILEYMFMTSNNLFVVAMVILGTGLTVGYSFRMLYLSGSNVNVVNVVSGSQDVSWLVLTSVACLFMASLVSGFVMYWAGLPSLSVSYLGGAQKLFIVVASLLGGVLSYSYMQSSNMKFGDLKLVETLVGMMWFMPSLSVNSPYLCLLSGQIGFKVVDNGWFEYYGGQGGRGCLLGVSELLQVSQKSVMVKGYMISAMISGACLFMFY